MSRTNILKSAIKPSLENGDAVAELSGSSELPPAEVATYPEDQLGGIDTVSKDVEALEAVAHGLECLVQAIEACGVKGLDEQGKRFGAVALYNAQSFVGMASGSVASLEADGDLASKAAEFLKKVWEAIKAAAAKLWQAVKNFIVHAKQAMAGLGHAADELIAKARKGLVVKSPKVRIPKAAAVQLESEGHIGNLVEIASHVEQAYGALMNLPSELRPRNDSILALFKRLADPKLSEEEWKHLYSESQQSFTAAHPSVFNKKVSGQMACQPIPGGLVYAYHAGTPSSDKGIAGALASYMLGELAGTSIIESKYGLDIVNERQYSAHDAKDTVEVQTLSASDLERLAEIVKRVVKLGEEKINDIFKLEGDFKAVEQGLTQSSMMKDGVEGRRAGAVAQLYHCSLTSLERKDSQLFFTLSGRLTQLAKACLIAGEAMVAAHGEQAAA